MHALRAGCASCVPSHSQRQAAAGALGGIGAAHGGRATRGRALRERGITVIGARGVTADGYREALSIIEQGRFPLERMRTHRDGVQAKASGVALERVQRAERDGRRGLVEEAEEAVDVVDEIGQFARCDQIARFFAQVLAAVQQHRFGGRASPAQGAAQTLGNLVPGDFAEELREGSIPCLLYTSPSPRDRTRSRMPSSA